MTAGMRSELNSLIQLSYELQSKADDASALPLQDDKSSAQSRLSQSLTI
jgi:hypothetical protein